MPKYTIERGRDEDFVLVGGVPAGVITRGRHGRATTCTIEGQRTQGANGECRQGEHPEWIAKTARRAGLVGVGAPRKRKPSDKLRDQERPEVFGYELDRETLTPRTTRLAPTTPVVAPPAEIAAGTRVKSLVYGDGFQGKVIGGAGRWVMVQWDGYSKPTEERAVDLQAIDGVGRPCSRAAKRLGAIITGDEERRLDALTERHTAILAKLEGDQLDQLLSDDVKRRGRSDAAVRRAALDNVHPDDLEAAIVARGLGSHRRARRVAPALSGDQAYRGYLIKPDVRGQTFITKDGFHIGYAPDVATAKRTIDELID